MPARVLAILAFLVILLSTCGRADNQSGPPSGGAGIFELSTTAERTAGTASSRTAQREEKVGVRTAARHPGREAEEAASGASRGAHAAAGDGVESGPSSHMTSDPGSPLTRFSLILLVLAVFVGTAVGLRRLV